jgi:hypothetical protein
LVFLALTSCKDNKKIIQEAKAMHQDSASLDSINFSKLKAKDEKINGIIVNGRFYSTTQLDSIFTGKKRY